MSFVFLVAMECWLTWSGTEAVDAGKSQGLADAALLRTARFPTTLAKQRDVWARYHLSGAGSREGALVWIDQLGAAGFRERETAQNRLVQLGPGVICLLRSFAANEVPERQKRVQSCLRVLERDVDANALEASIRGSASKACALELWRLLESCPDAYLEEEIAGEVLRLARSDDATLAMIKGGAKSSSGAQRACSMIASAESATEITPTLWKKAKDQAPHWPLFRSDANRGKEWEVGPTYRSRRSFERFMDAMRKRDREGMMRLCHLPFCLSGRLVVQSGGELDELLDQTLEGLKGEKWSCQILAVLPLAAYAASEEEHALLAGLPARAIRVIRVRTAIAGERSEEGHFFMFLDPTPRLMGIGQK